MNRSINKKTLKEILPAYVRQIRKDMGFWINYRPSRLVNLHPEKFIRPLMKLINSEGDRNLYGYWFFFSVYICWSHTNFKFYLVNIFRI